MKSDAIDRGGASHLLIELALARLREFAREPEAVFWAFIFPILMSVTMAAAFPGSGQQAGGRRRSSLAPARAAIRATLAHAPGITFATFRRATRRARFAKAKCICSIVPTDPPTYRFDPARDESRVALSARRRCAEAGGGTHRARGRRMKSRCRSRDRATSTG